LSAYLRFLFFLLVVTLLCAGEGFSLYSSSSQLFRPNDGLNVEAFEHFYNLDYDRSVQEFQQVLQRHPDDPSAVNHVITAVLMRELYRMGALNSGEYANRLVARPGTRRRIRSRHLSSYPNGR
jgi:hypothetical protein